MERETRKYKLAAVPASTPSGAPSEPTVDGDCWHQIEEGLFEAIYIGDVSDRKLWGGKRVARLRITDGKHAEKILRWYAQTPLKPGGRTKLAVTYNSVTGRRPPKNLAELGLGRWLSGRVLEVKVEFTKRDGKGTKTTDLTRYSIVSQILRTIAGSGDIGSPHA